MLLPPTRLQDRIAQLIFPRIGSNMRPTRTVEDDARRIEALLEERPFGGLVLFNGDRIRTPWTLSRLQTGAQYPLLICTDMERGVGQQLRGATVFPHAMAFGSMPGALDRVAESSSIAAREALAAGIHVGFHPVADVASNPHNPIISTRAYGTEPDFVSKAVRTCIRACNREGLLATAKHFPGHGDTDTDSHESLPRVHRPKTELDALELPPFRAAIEEGVPLMMTAHVAYDALDGTGSSATASRPILTDLLRKSLRFRGVVITDSLLMAGANGSTKESGRGVWAAAMIQAGVDILLDVEDPVALARDLEHEVEQGRLSARNIDAAFQRVWALKARVAARFGPGVFIDPSLAHLPSIIGSDSHRSVADSIANEAVQILDGSLDQVRNRTDLPGVKPGLALLIRPHTTYNDPTAGSFDKAFRHYVPELDVRELDPDVADRDLDALLEEASGHAFVLAAIVVKPAAWHRFGLLPRQQEFVRALTERTKTIVASLGHPVALKAFPEAVVRMSTYSDVEPSLRALARTMGTLASAPQDEVSWVVDPTRA